MSTAQEPKCYYNWTQHDHGAIEQMFYYASKTCENPSEEGLQWTWVSYSPAARS